jgi:uncharacterized protein YdeI (YjbR/CyaY-like superfamily)
MTPAPAKQPRPRIDPRFFATQAAWRAWLTKHYAKETQLWVGFWRVATGRPCITWPQSVDEALCFGWIDGLRRGLDKESYAIRFSPRKPESKWSRVNLKRFAELESEGLVHAAGRAARAKWDPAAAPGYSYEKPSRELDTGLVAKLRRNAQAWRFWNAQTPYYRKMAGGWVTGAKRPETRERRFAELVRACEAAEAVRPLAKLVKVKRVD